MGEDTAKLNLQDLHKALGISPEGENGDSTSLIMSTSPTKGPSPANDLHRYRVRRESMELLDLIKVCFLFINPLPLLHLYILSCILQTKMCAHLLIWELRLRYVNTNFFLSLTFNRNNYC